MAYTWRGAWSSAVAYPVDSMVSLAGNYFVTSVATTAGQSPPGTPWSVVPAPVIPPTTVPVLPGAPQAPFLPEQLGGSRTSETKIINGVAPDLPSSASWVIAVNSAATPLQGSILAEPGDRIRVDLGMAYSGAHFLDLALLDTAGAILSYAGSGSGTPLAEGNPEFRPDLGAPTLPLGKASSGTIITATAGSIRSGGVVTIALVHQGTSDGLVHASATSPWRMTLTNLGPAPAPSSVVTTLGGTPSSGYIKYAPPGVALSGSDVTGPYLYLGAGQFTIGSATPNPGDPLLVLPITRYPNTRGTLSSSQSTWSVSFGTDAPDFQFRFNFQTAGFVRILVDGKPLTELMRPIGGTTPGSTHLITVTLGTAQPRIIRIDCSVVPFGGVYLPPTATMWKPKKPPKRMLVLGDSLSGGSNENAGGGAGTWFNKCARLLGYEDSWNEGIGSTGYITPGTSVVFATRLPLDVVPHTPDLLFVWGGYNDNGGDQGALATAASALYAGIRTGLPNAKTIVIGCYSPSGTPGASITNTDNTLRTAAAAAGFPFISPITGNVYGPGGTLISTTGPWITGTGRVGAPAGNGNADFYVGTDAIHPTDAGHKYIANRVYAAVKEIEGT